MKWWVVAHLANRSLQIPQVHILETGHWQNFMKIKSTNKCRKDNKETGNGPFYKNEMKWQPK